jgi:hypothetical protein
MTYKEGLALRDLVVLVKFDDPAILIHPGRPIPLLPVRSANESMFLI